MKINCVWHIKPSGHLVHICCSLNAPLMTVSVPTPVWTAVFPVNEPDHTVDRTEFPELEAVHLTEGPGSGD